MTVEVQEVLVDENEEDDLDEETVQSRPAIPFGPFSHAPSTHAVSLSWSIRFADASSKDDEEKEKEKADETKQQTESSTVTPTVPGHKLQTTNRKSKDLHASCCGASTKQQVPPKRATALPASRIVCEKR
eukprot:1131347-Amphidinium_carterae.2